eukprot:Opistho-1_new@48186
MLKPVVCLVDLERAFVEGQRLVVQLLHVVHARNVVERRRDVGVVLAKLGLVNRARPLVQRQGVLVLAGLVVKGRKVVQRRRNVRMVLGIDVLVDTEGPLVQRQRKLVLSVRRVDAGEVVERVRDVRVAVAHFRLADLQLLLEKFERVQAKAVLLQEAPDESVQQRRLRLVRRRLEALGVETRNLRAVRADKPPVAEELVLFAVEHLLEHRQIREARLHAVAVVERLEEPGELVDDALLNRDARLSPAHLARKVGNHSPEKGLALAAAGVREVPPLDGGEELLVEEPEQTGALDEKVAARVKDGRPQRLLNAENVEHLHFAEAIAGDGEAHEDVLDNVCALHPVLRLELREHVLKQLHGVVALEAALDVPVELAKVPKRDELLEKQRRVQWVAALLRGQHHLHLARLVRRLARLREALARPPQHAADEEREIVLAPRLHLQSGRPVAPVNGVQHASLDRTVHVLHGGAGKTLHERHGRPSVQRVEAPSHRVEAAVGQPPPCTLR